METLSSLSLIGGRRRTTSSLINQTKGDALVQNGNATHMQKGTESEEIEAPEQIPPKTSRSNSFNPIKDIRK